METQHQWASPLNAKCSEFLQRKKHCLQNSNLSNYQPLSVRQLQPTDTWKRKISPFKTLSLGPGEMTQQGGTFAALAEDLSWAPNLTTVSNSSCRGANSSPDL